MRSILLAAGLLLLAPSLHAQTYVKGHVKKDGTYVQGHYRAKPDAYRYNNPSSQSRGGTKRDEFSLGGGATNKRNSAYGAYDNDRDGVYNKSDRAPDKKDCVWPEC